VGDFCYSRPMLKRVLDQAELMDRVMEAVGIEAVRAARLDSGPGMRRARAASLASMTGNVGPGSRTSAAVKRPGRRRLSKRGVSSPGASIKTTVSDNGG
jgi:hypothetical protein